MKLGDRIKSILAPFVKGTKYATCDACENRRIILNTWSDWIIGMYKKLTCTCFWKRILKIK